MPRTLAEARDLLNRHHVVHLPLRSVLGPGENASFGFTRTMPADDVLAWLATSSDFIAAPAAEREAALARCAEVLPGQAGAGAVIEMPLRSRCWRADRL